MYYYDGKVIRKDTEKEFKKILQKKEEHYRLREKLVIDQVRQQTEERVRKEMLEEIIDRGFIVGRREGNSFKQYYIEEIITLLTKK